MNVRLCATLLLISFSTAIRGQDWKQLPTTKLSADINRTVESHPAITFTTWQDDQPRKLQLDLYRPRHTSGRLPAIVCIHGGGWAKGQRIHHTHIAKALAARGYVTVSIDYRLSGEAAFPAQIHDCKAAVRWLRAHADDWRIDADHIGATGASAGGHLAALLATSANVRALEGDSNHVACSSAIQAAVPMGGQSDLTSTRIQRISQEKQIYQQFLEGSYAQAPDTYRLASPRTHLDADDPPLLFLTGELDDPSTHGDAFRADCQRLQIPSRLSVIAGAPHPFLTRQPFFDQAVDQIDAFFSQHLKRKPADSRGR